jgi:guanine nucleotide-binding protein G(i) subunit alpha
MGNCIGSKPLDVDDLMLAETSVQIDKMNEEDFEVETEKIKLLLLGTGESGKSTVMKQMRIIYGDEYTRDELESYKITVQQNCVDFMETMCKAVKNFSPGDAILQSEEYAAVALPDDASTGQYRTFPEWTEGYVEAMGTLWRHPTFKDAFSKRMEFQIIESTSEFLDRLDEVDLPLLFISFYFTAAQNNLTPTPPKIVLFLLFPQVADEDYVPTKADILGARLRTRGINEERLNIDGQVFCFFDVGGQRNERRKWMKIFDGVHGVVFIAALSEFNQTLWEANNVNRISEALTVFEEYVNKDEFENSAFILFLNKADLFRKKIEKTNLAEVPGYGDYKGKPFDYDDGVEYFTNKFLRRNLIRDNVFVHVTTATDTSSVGVVFNACKKVIVERNVEDFMA